MTSKQIKYFRPVDPVSRWNFLQNDTENAAHYLSTLLGTKKLTLLNKAGFPHPDHQTPIQVRILRALQELKKLNP